MEYIDISVLLNADMPVWPGSSGFKLVPCERMTSGAEANVSKLECDIHIGTHIDAPWHFLEHGETVENISVNQLIGKCCVVDLPNADVITAELLEKQDLPSVERVLFRTTNSTLWESGIPGFKKDFVALSADAAEWLVEQSVRVVGVDYLSVQRYEDSSLTHEILLKASVVIIEGLNLASVQAGAYELICLPLKIEGAEGAPARAVLRRLSQ